MFSKLHMSSKLPRPCPFNQMSLIKIIKITSYTVHLGVEIIELFYQNVSLYKTQKKMPFSRKYLQKNYSY